MQSSVEPSNLAPTAALGAEDYCRRARHEQVPSNEQASFMHFCHMDCSFEVVKA